MDISVIKSITESSNVLNEWSLSIIGGALAAILSTSYIKPVKKWWKLIYLLYLPGWFFLLFALKENNYLNRRGLMATIQPKKLEKIVGLMNDHYLNQLDYFQYSLYCFCAWLVLYLIWWIFNDITNNVTENAT